VKKREYKHENKRDNNRTASALTVEILDLSYAREYNKDAISSEDERCLSMECGCEQKHDVCCQEVDTSLLDSYLAGVEGPLSKGKLIPVLQAAQDIYGYLPDGIIQYIAVRLRVKPAKIMSVVSFYTQFRTKPVGKNLILLCQGTACHVNGSPVIEASLKEALGVEEGEISSNGLFTYNNVACIGCCSLAPVMMVGKKAYGGLTKTSVARIIKDIEHSELAEQEEDE